MISTVTKPTRIGTFERLLKWAAVGRTIAVLGAIVLVLTFYAEENWRGKRAWEKCKRQLNVERPVLDWASYVPEPVPAEQNIFKAPKMSSWLGTPKGNHLSARLSALSLARFVRERNRDALAEVTIISPEEVRNNAGLLLDYHAPLLTVLNKADHRISANSKATVIPLIVLDEVPLTDAIRNLAKQAELKYVLGYGYDPRDGNGVQPLVSMRWEDVTAMEALTEVLNNHGLEWQKSPRSKVAYVALRNPEGPVVRVDALAIRFLTRKLAPKGVGGTNSPETSANGSQGLTFVLESRKEAPVEILVRAEVMPGTNEVSHFFWPLASGNQPFVAEPSGSNSFLLFRTPTTYAAADYLAWSDQFTNDFDHIRQALSRPYARLDGDYQDPAHVPYRNLTTLRMGAQTLGQRAQCQLLLGKPEKALLELNLLYELPRLLGGKPNTLVDAMLTMAIRGVYLDVVADGLRRHRWREQELVALQEQLQQVELLPLVLSAALEERAAECRVLEARNFKTILENATFRFTPLSRGEQRVKDLQCWLLGFVPKGWIFLNMAEVARLEEKFVRAYDPVTHCLSPANLDAAGQIMEKALHPSSPRNFLAARMVFNETRFWQSSGRRQAMAESARVACALERFHLAHGKYPESLASLSPEFIATLPNDLVNGQPLHYHPTGDGHFVIYSVGWNEKDEGGLEAKFQDGSVDVDGSSGDWVWKG
jgi:hypothetical protein